MLRNLIVLITALLTVSAVQANEIEIDGKRMGGTLDCVSPADRGIMGSVVNSIKAKLTGTDLKLSIDIAHYICSKSNNGYEWQLTSPYTTIHRKAIDGTSYSIRKLEIDGLITSERFEKEKAVRLQAVSSQTLTYEWNLNTFIANQKLVKNNKKGLYEVRLQFLESMKAETIKDGVSVDGPYRISSAGQSISFSIVGTKTGWELEK